MPSITRRDFINGCAVAVVASLSDATFAEAPGDVKRLAPAGASIDPYPPRRSGLRGSHPGSFEAAHAVRDGEHFATGDLPIEERYDLIVVGGGLSGLSAAYFYRQQRPTATILVLDTNDDFGGHAKRNEYLVDGRRLIGYGGTQSIDSPKRRYTGASKRLLRELGVDLTRFDTAYDRDFYQRRGMTRGIFFKREAFGVDTLIRQPYGRWDEVVEGSAPIDAVRAFVDRFPLSDSAKSLLIELHTSSRDVLAGKTGQERTAILNQVSAREFLKTYWKADDAVLQVLQNLTNSLWAVGLDGVSASKALELPGFQSQRAYMDDAEDSTAEPYIYHFPDGNASLARLLVRRLIPGSAKGHTMEDIVTAEFDYGKLDLPSAPVRIRLSSTVINIQNTTHGIEAAYSSDGKLHKIAAREAVLACYQCMMPYLMPELGDAQRKALSQNVRAPLVYVTLAARNWLAWHALGVAYIRNPGGTFEASLDYPVSLGAYRFSANPAEPICIHLEWMPSTPDTGLSMRDQYRAGRARLYAMTFGDFEREIRDELGRMLAPGGFDFDRDIAAITVNRWPHGYAYTPDSYADAGSDMAAVAVTARQRQGRIAIANSDSGWDAYTDVAIDQAYRAVTELLG